MTTTTTSARALLDSAISEKAFQAQVIRLAELNGWTLIYHTHDSRRSAKGFPDLVICRPGRIIFAELKRQRGKVSAEQQQWLEALWAAVRAQWLYNGHDEDTPDVLQAFLWRPSDWEQIEHVLSDTRRRTSRRTGAA